MGVDKNIFSHLTAKERERMSFPTRWLLNNEHIKGKVLDFGCGFGKDVEVLKEKGFSVKGFDPYYFPKEIEGKYDTIICNYVLNVLQPLAQSDVIMDVSKYLNSGGKAYFSVRRDVTYQGFRTHKVHKKPTYQCNVILPFKSIFINDFCEIYEYQHYTDLNKGNAEVSPFFAFDDEKELIVESASAFSFFDKYPVTKGHALVIPKRLTASYFDLTQKEQTACWLVVNKVKSILNSRFKPDGFNIGINAGDAAGQTIPHAHIHVIPRYEGDMDDPRGGVRHVIPSKGNYLK